MIHTRDGLSRYVNNISSICPMCNLEDENRFHLFINCGFVRLVWNCQAISKNTRLNQSLPFNDWLNALAVRSDEGLCDLSKALLICWQIGKRRI